MIDTQNQGQDTISNKIIKWCLIWPYNRKHYLYYFIKPLKVLWSLEIS